MLQSARCDSESNKQAGDLWANFVIDLSPGVLYVTADKKVCEIIWDIRRTQKNRVN